MKYVSIRGQCRRKWVEVSVSWIKSKEDLWSPKSMQILNLLLKGGWNQNIDSLMISNL